MNTLRILVLFTFGVVAGNAFAADIEAGKKIGAGICSNCHGATGVSASDPFPNLAGQKPGYLKNALKAYKEGTRKAEIMNNMAAGLSEQDMENVAAYFSGLKPAP
jgi:cytochrome c553